MKGSRAFAFAAAGALALGACLAPVRDEAGDNAEDAAGRAFLAEAVVGNWWPASATAARRAIEQYGVPDEVHPGRLVWNDNGPWKRTVVRDRTPPYGAPRDLNLLEQSVGYELPPARARELAEFDQRITYDPDDMALTARSGSEELNFLRLNLADDIAQGRRTGAQAREFGLSVRALMDAGKTSTYILGLRFGGERHDSGGNP